VFYSGVGKKRTVFDEYLDFEIRIGASGPDGYALDVSGPGGDARGTLVLPSYQPEYLVLADRLATFEVDEMSLAALGQLLFEALFQGEIREVYARTQGMLQPRQGLRLELCIAATEVEVAALPWEFLHDPDQGPLTLLDVSIVRYIPQPTRIPTLKTHLPLRVLLTGAQTPPPTHIERELRQIEAALLDLGGHVQLTVEPHLTQRKLQNLLRNQYDIWHFVGHGEFSRDGRTGQLCLEDEAGDTAFVSALQLGIALHRCGVRLIVLDACHGAHLALDPFRSVAPALVRAQIPAVVAMQFSAPAASTRVFATEFYNGLASGLPIDACVTEGRKAVMSATGLHRPDWGIPVVYTRADDGRLFELPNRPSSAPISAGLIGLTQQLRVPQVYAVLSGFRADFQAACEQIALINQCKQLHDQLQELDKPYTIIDRGRRRLSIDPLAWDDLSTTALELEIVIGEVIDLANQPLSTVDSSWCVQHLTQSRAELYAAFDLSSLEQLDSAVGRLRRVLAREPSRINTRLVTAAGALRLEQLMRAMTTVRDILARTSPGIAVVRHLNLLVDQLSELNQRLDTLVDNHNRWQEIDDELRRVEANVAHDLVELELAWPDLRGMVQVVLNGGSADWARSLGQTLDGLDHALAAGDTVRVRRMFIGFRSQANGRFCKVDDELLRTCNDLQQIGESLDLLLKAIEDEQP
jgi:hypothetical protein